jgi:hypothetical protein
VTDSVVHPVFHVSQLKRAVGRDSTLIPQLPNLSDPLHVPLSILQTSLVERGGEFIRQVKVTWSDMPVELATWEDADALRARFPAAPAWGQASSEGWGNVSTTQPVDEKEATEESSEGTKRLNRKRYRRPNMKYVGPQWVTSCVRIRFQRPYRL